MNYEGMMIFENDIYRFNEKRDQLLIVAADSKSLAGDWCLDLKDLDEQEDRYAGYYNWEAKKFEHQIDGYEPYWWEFVHLSKSFVTHGDKMSAGEIHAINALNIEYDNSPFVIDQEVANRLNGQLTEVEIDGLVYIADGQRNIVYRRDNPNIKFCFPGNALNMPQIFFYNRREKMPCNVDYKGTLSPDRDVVALKLPSLYMLDPIGCHLQDPSLTLKDCVHVMKMHESRLVVQVIPFEQTRTAEWIKRNQQQQGNNSTQKKKKQVRKN